MNETHILEELVPLEALRAVQVAARRGSFSAAALELRVTHGAISRRVHAVEVWLGQSVFERHGRGVRLTPIGQHLVRSVEKSLGALASIAKDIRAANATETLRVSMLPSFARLWFMARISSLQGNPPDLGIQVIADHRVASLEQREADVAIRFGNGFWPGTDAIPLFSEELVPVASPELADRLLGGEPKALLAATLVHDTDSQDWKRWCQSVGIPYRPLAGERRFDDYDLALLAAEAGLGIAIARRPLANAAITSGRLVTLGNLTVESERRHYVVTRARESRTAVLRFRDRVVEASADVA